MNDTDGVSIDRSFREWERVGGRRGRVQQQGDGQSSQKSSSLHCIRPNCRLQKVAMNEIFLEVLGGSYLKVTLFVNCTIGFDTYYYRYKNFGLSYPKTKLKQNFHNHLPLFSDFRAQHLDSALLMLRLKGYFQAKRL